MKNSDSRKMIIRASKFMKKDINYLESYLRFLVNENEKLKGNSKVIKVFESGKYPGIDARSIECIKDGMRQSIKATNSVMNTMNAHLISAKEKYSMLNGLL